MVDTRKSNAALVPIQLDNSGKTPRKVTAKGYGGRFGAPMRSSAPLPPPSSPPPNALKTPDGSPKSFNSSFFSGSGPSLRPSTGRTPPPQHIPERSSVSPVSTLTTVPSSSGSDTRSRSTSGSGSGSQRGSPSPQESSHGSRHDSFTRSPHSSSRGSPSGSSHDSSGGSPSNSPLSSGSSENDHRERGPPYRTSDTPPLRFFPIAENRHARELDNGSISRQAYIHISLRSLRNHLGFWRSIPGMLGWRFGFYPFKTYIHPTVNLLLTSATLCLLHWLWRWFAGTWMFDTPPWQIWWMSVILFPFVLAIIVSVIPVILPDWNGSRLVRKVILLAISAVYLDCIYALTLYAKGDPSSLPTWESYVYLIWLSLHIFDLYRACEYIHYNPPWGIWGSRANGTDFMMRCCAMARALARIVIIVFGALACLEPNMTVDEYWLILPTISRLTFRLAVLCGFADIAVYWFVGCFRISHEVPAWKGGRIGPDGRPEPPPTWTERWQFECVLPWCTLISSGYAVWLFGWSVNLILRRGWWVDSGSMYRLVGMEMERVLPPRGTGWALF